MSTDSDLLDVLRQLPLPIIVCRVEGGEIALINEAWRERFSLSDELPHSMELWWMQAFPDPAYRRAVRADWDARVERVIARGEPTLPVEVSLKDRSGQEREVHIHVTCSGPWRVLSVIEHSQPAKPVQQEEERDAGLLVDALTGLPGHTACDEYIERQLQLCQRHKQSLSLIMVEVANAKAIRQQAGIEALDKATLHATGVIRGTVRTSDFVARYRSDRFLIVLPATDVKGASLLAERLRQRVTDCDPSIQEWIGAPLEARAAAAGALDAEYQRAAMLAQLTTALTSPSAFMAS